VGVLGASGYAGRELCGLIARHPGLELAFASANEQRGQRARIGASELIYVATEDAPLHEAEVVFTAHEEIGSAQAFYADVKGRMAKFGRHPDDLKIMPGLSVTVAPTQQEAEDKFQSLQDLIHPEIGVAILSRKMGFDFRGFPIDGPVPDIPKSNVLSSRVDTMVAAAQAEQLSIRQLYQRFCASRGHFSVVGTPADVVDQMSEWFSKGAADGFNFMAPILPGGLDDFVDLVVPELQRRGLFRTRYEGPMLRDNLGLKKPVSRYAREKRDGLVAATGR